MTYNDIIMSLTVHIPDSSKDKAGRKAAFTLYARGEAEDYATAPGHGSLIEFSDGSVVLLFYRYSRHRRAYIVREIGALKNYQPVKLPAVEEPVGILARVRGRRIDILRRAYFNLERIGGPGVYRFGNRFWQRIACLLDNYDGRGTACIKSNLAELVRRYVMAAGHG
jgi:hypothetical protein